MDYKSFTQKTFIFLGISTLFVLLASLLITTAHILLTVFAGILLAVPLSWLTNKLHNLIKLPRSIVLVCLILLLTGIGSITVKLSAPVISTQAAELMENLPFAIQKIRKYLNNYNWGEPVSDSLEDLSQQPEKLLEEQDMEWSSIVSRVSGIFSDTFSIVSSIFIILLVSIYLALEPKLYINGLVHLFPKTQSSRIRSLCDDLGHTIRWWLIGQIFSMAILGISTMVMLSILDVPLALLLALLTALMTFIPNFGPIIAGIPTVLVALTVSPWTALLVAVFYIILQNLEGSLITPLIQRKVIALPPVLVLTAQVVFAYLVGAIGIVLATPLVACLIVITKKLYVQDTLGYMTDKTE